MKRLVVGLVLVVAGVAVLGFYRGWFEFGVNKEKFQEDRKAAVAGVKNLGSKTETEEKVAGKSHDGKVVSITGAKLVMTNMEGEEEHMHALTADAKITCDGKACKAADLKSGMRIRVTTEHAEPHSATRIEAIDVHPDFEKGV